jgi:transcriptional regulator with XRE-family HTH domain
MQARKTKQKVDKRKTKGALKVGGGKKPAGGAASPRAAVSARAPANGALKVRRQLGVTLKVFARMTGFSERAIAGWESGRKVSEPGARRLKEMERLRRALVDVMPEDVIPSWLETECKALGGLKPIEVLERGEIDRLWRTIFSWDLECRADRKPLKAPDHPGETGLGSEDAARHIQIQ